MCSRYVTFITFLLVATQSFWGFGSTQLFFLSKQCLYVQKEEKSEDNENLYCTVAETEEEAPPPPPPRAESLTRPPARPLPAIPSSASMGKSSKISYQTIAYLFLIILKVYAPSQSHCNILQATWTTQRPSHLALTKALRHRRHASCLRLHLLRTMRMTILMKLSFLKGAYTLNATGYVHNSIL